MPTLKQLLRALPEEVQEHIHGYCWYDPENSPMLLGWVPMGTVRNCFKTLEEAMWPDHFGWVKHWIRRKTDECHECKWTHIESDHNHHARFTDVNPFEDLICETGGPGEIVYHITEDAFNGEMWMRDRCALHMNLLCQVQQLAQLHIVAWIRGCQVRQQLRKQHLAATRIQLCWLERSMRMSLASSESHLFSSEDSVGS